MTRISLPNKMAVASFDVDAQNCFTPICPLELPVDEGDKIVDELNLQASVASMRLGSKDAHSPKAIWVADHEHPAQTPLNSPNADQYWPRHAVPGTPGFNLIKGLPKVTEYDYFVWKGVELDLHPYGACYHDIQEQMSTGVIEFLQQGGINTVIVGGLATDYCVKTTVEQLLRAGFDVIVNLGACRGVARQTTSDAIVAMQRQGAIMIGSAKELNLTTRKTTNDFIPA